ncbi:phage tail assembly chaperone [Sphingomonas flavescens]|uniref:phage tail assembly chaperone n=1 Tax=Sphingomonas flavescens TaxID=3132797 RepID=UPI002804023C|nr:phage tail assembly chaperone [Sphingomonas limnosediminicola]
MLEFGQGAARLSGAAALLLGWRPEEFWNATPAELALALSGPGPAADGPERDVIDALRKRFPDDEISHG